MEQTSTHKWTDMNTPMIVTSVVVGLLLVLGIVTPAVWALVYHVEGRFIAVSVTNTSNDERVNHEIEEFTKIEGPARWINQGRGIVSIPIGQAMKLYVEQEQARSQ
ncbi:MAG: hypothetical protein WC058_07575 [Phycisphaeraceae bacterium]